MDLYPMDPSTKNQLYDCINQYLQQKYENTAKDSSKAKISYGTAGFRGPASELEHLFYNVGLISAVRCLHTKVNIGIMITASHNPIQDNGVKIIDGNGEMLEIEWESLVEEFCNTREADLTLEQLESLIGRFEIDTRKPAPGQILIAMDTRPSSEALCSSIKRALDAWSPIVQYREIGLATTPALHYLVAESNKRAIGDLSLDIYYEQLIDGYDAISEDHFDCKLYDSSNLVIDCANGVGYETLRRFCNDKRFLKHLPFKLINTGEGILNKSCGADHVKTLKVPPSGAIDTSKRYASLDGDADRVVYFYLEGGAPNALTLRLLDGDKIMALYALYLKGILRKCNLDHVLTLGIVQTAYANGASTDYMRKHLDLEVDFVDTGVKNLHRKAIDYDFGVYFEANGHGTIWVSPKARKIIKNSVDNRLQELKRLLSIINNYTGDAISDILVVEMVLRHYDWDIASWYELYQDRPNSLIKIQVPDRNCIKTTSAGRTCTEPEGVQTVIDSIVIKFGSNARCFVRPSGTENVVRVYAEADDADSAKNLALEVGHQVSLICNNSS